MALTGHLFIAVLVLIALTLFVLVLLDLPRARRRWARRSVRGVEVVTLNLVVVTLCFALLNDQYVFYESWGDLLGSQGRAVGRSYGAQPAAAAAGAVGSRFAHWSTPARLPDLPSPGARLQTYSIPGAAPGTFHQVLVYLPAGYHASSPRTYPVLVGLPGLPSTPENWIHMLGIDSTVDAAVASHHLAAPILVLPQVNEPPMFDTECVDSPDPAGPHIDTWLSSDLPRWIVGHFRVTRARSAWAVMGYSYGGWCAASQLFRHPDLYSSGVVFEGYFHPEFTQAFDPFPRGSPQLAAYDLARLAAVHRTRVALWILAAKGDHNSYSSTERFLAAVRPPTSVTAEILPTGGHRISVFLPYVPMAIRWLATNSPGFTSAAPA